jgi:hypothetical protein
MQLCMAHLLVVANFRYLRNSASDGAKSWIFGGKSLYFQSHVLSFEDIKTRRSLKDAP